MYTRKTVLLDPWLGDIVKQFIVNADTIFRATTTFYSS